jgi:hypothetical protein
MLIFLSQYNSVTIPSLIVPTDPYWTDVSLLMHMEGTNNGTTFFDETGKIITKSGTVVTNTAISKFGLSSADFSGGTLYTPVSSGFQFTSDFTIEGWIRFDSTAGGVQCLYGQKGAGSNYFYVGWYGNNGQWTCALNGQANLSFTNSAPTAGQWYHIALVRSGTGIKLYVNGVGGSTITNSSTLGYNNVAAYVGSTYTGENTLYGNIDDIRVTKGVARYTSNFTPPTEPFPDASNSSYYWDNISSLIHFEGADNSTSITDEKGLTWTNTNAVISTAVKKFGTSSLSFNGNAKIVSSTMPAIGTGDFTAEMWFNASSLPAYAWLLGGNASNAFDLILKNGGTEIQVYLGSGGYVKSIGYTVQTGTWYHLALSRTAGTMRVFINGTLIGSSNASPENIAAQSIRLGQQFPDNYPFTGYIDDFRVTMGIGLYTANFTPTTSAFPDAPTSDRFWAYTKLAMKMNGTDGGTTFTDEKGHTITPTGVTTSTSVKKFGTASAYFPGSGGNRLTTPNSADFIMGTGDYTIEGWIYATSLPASTARRIVAIGRNSVAFSLSVVINPAGNVRADIGVATVLTSSSTITTNTWTHFALVKSSGVMTLYMNGVSAGTVSNSTSLTFTQTLMIGYDDTVGSGSEFAGYMDDVRITKGVARYTGNFVPRPSEMITV